MPPPVPAGGPGLCPVDHVGQLEQILGAERSPACRGHRERVRWQRICPPSRHRQHPAAQIADIDHVVAVVLATLDELQVLAEERTKPVRYPHTRDGYGASSASRAFDDGIQQRRGAGHQYVRAAHQGLRLHALHDRRPGVPRHPLLPSLDFSRC